MYVALMLFPELDIVVLDPSGLVQMAVQQYLSERTVLEAQLAVNASHDGETPLVSSADNQLNESSKVIISEADDGGGDGDGENPAVEMDNEEPGNVEVSTSRVENLEHEESGVSCGVKEDTSNEQQPSLEDLPPYFSEVYKSINSGYSNGAFCDISMQLSVVGGLGWRAYQTLCRGDQVPDHITVAIIVETLR